jgi:diguanylate cyclase (GGDEF)-like protein
MNDKRRKYDIEASSEISIITENNENIKYLWNFNDAATSLYNKDYLYANWSKIALQMIKGVRENEKSKNLDTTWSVMFCDIDGLKLVNDSMGHDIGDQVIIKMAHIIKNTTRSNSQQHDTVVCITSPKKEDGNISIRAGGDEFIIILPNCTKEQALLVKNRINNEVENNKDDLHNSKLSMGIADTSEIELPKNVEDFKEVDLFLKNLIAKADNEMFIDKRKNIDILTDEEKEKLIS